MNTTRLMGLGLLVVMGCGGGGGASIPLADLKPRLVAAICSTQVRCGYQPDQATCEKTGSSDLQIDAEVASGKTVYDGQAAVRCLDAYSNIACNVSDQGDLTALVDACNAVFAGTVQNGAACLVGEDCVSGSCNIASCIGTACCMGTCQAQVPAGGDCLPSGSLCVKGTFCRYNSGGSTATCTAIIAEGQPCDAGDSCVSGTSCLADRVKGTPGTCGKPPAEGSPCPVDSCDSAFDVCDPTSKTCTRRIAVGDACTTAGTCVPYATCDTTAGVCRALGGVGADCSSNPCLSGLSCTNGTCVTPSDLPACP